MIVCSSSVRLLRHLSTNVAKPSILAREISTLAATSDVSSWNQILQCYCRNGWQEKVLLLYQEMRDSGVQPNASTFPSLLRSCGENLQIGGKIHTQILRSGCEADPYVGSSLVHFYARCERIEDAHQMFDQMPQRSVVSWTALVQGYARIGRSREAMILFNQMRREGGIMPNAVSVVSLFPAFSHSGNGEFKFELLHAYAIKLGLESDSLVGTSLTDMYMKCGAVENASRIFHGLHDKSLVSWLVMVSGLAQNGLLQDAVSLVARMWVLSIMLDSTTALNLLSACADTGDLEHGRWVHMYMIKFGLELDTFAGTALLNMYAKCGLLVLARQVFDQMPERNVVAWNAIIYSYARLGFLQEVKELFGQMNCAGLSPDSITIKSLLIVALALPTSSALQLGECIHGYSIKHGVFYSEVAYVNSLLDFYAKVGNLQSARELFSCIEKGRDTISWNSMIGGYVQNGHGAEAVGLFSQMQLAGARPDSFTLSSVLTACACMGERLLGQYIHGYLMRHYCLLDSFVGTALVDMYAKCGDLVSAYRVFEKIPIKDTTTWNAMIGGYNQNGFATEALALFYGHLRTVSMAGSSLSEFSLATAVSACGQLGSLEGGRSLHGCILKIGLESGINVGNAIISMYSKSGLVEDAELFFERMVKRDVTSWTAMISGYAVNGKIRDALSLFEEMTMKKMVEPNGITFLEVLWACSHGGLVKEGWGYFERMRRMYGIEPKVEHYCCVVDLLGRAGYAYEGYVLIRSMEVRADAAVWGALLSACRIYGELELGEIAGKEILMLQGNVGYQVLLSNAYALSGRWEDSASVREKVRMEDLKMKKPLGLSCIEVREKVHWISSLQA